MERLIITPWKNERKCVVEKEYPRTRGKNEKSCTLEETRINARCGQCRRRLKGNRQGPIASECVDTVLARSATTEWTDIRNWFSGGLMPSRYAESPSYKSTADA